MRFDSISVSNYRNIDGVKIVFHPECNYIIGENNLGKSNLLSLLTTVCNGKAFDESDYYNPEKPIIVDLNVRLCASEQGLFGDSFAPDDASLIRIRYSQAIQDAYPTVINVDSNENISLRQIRKISYLKYETTAVPSKELKIDSQNGIGRFIRAIIERFNDGTGDYLNNQQIEDLTEHINGYLSKIRGFKEYSIKATIAQDSTEMLTSMFYLSDGNRKIDYTGSGVQYMAMASACILGHIMELYKRKSIPFEDLIYTSEKGKRILPLILSVDEPEVHLHPYLQRSLIGFYKRILCNNDTGFAELLKDCFNIDGLDGQLVIVTHSTDAITGDYRNLVRFYKKGESIAAISGFELRPVQGQDNSKCVKAEYEKHLIMHFPEIKEAFYAKCAILIEGETEYGCIRAFADKVGVSLDDCGICAINAGGQNSIKPIRQLLNLFGIPSVAIYDGDVKAGHTPESNEFFTNELCFEIEIVKTLFSSSNAAVVRKIVTNMDNQADSKMLDIDFVRKWFKKMGVSIEGYTPKRLCDVSDSDATDFCQMFSMWFMAKKGVLLGRFVGEAIPAVCIPVCYRDAIMKAQEVALNA